MKVSISGVIAGGIVSLAASGLACLPLAIHMTPSSKFPYTLAPTSTNTVLYSAQVAIIFTCAILGGYVGAWFANQNERLNGTLSSFVLVGSAILDLVFRLGDDPHWLLLLMLIAGPAFAFIGGNLRLRTRHAR